ncbi:MAG: bifunctional oligoribonuclease/PAP phosphatase NrnA [Defluviitaleaceae bacterium]|nr:bifunctional oligoribonuclease/PAP phosphatase NrnA [Defluviitaleaceae bacterium]
MMKKNILKQIDDILREHDDFVVAGHVNPDGDSVGSCFGMAASLKKRGKSVTVVLESYHEKFNVIPGKNMLCGSSFQALKPGVLICLDCADVSRLGGAGVLIEKASLTVCVDHHFTNKGFADVNFIDKNASSTCELVFRLITDDALNDKDIAAALYAGMVHDTGGFCFASTDKKTMHAAGRLISTGIPYTHIYNELMTSKSLIETKLLGSALNDCGTYFGGKIVCACVTQEMLDNVQINASTVSKGTGKDLDGIVEQLLAVRGAEAAVLIYARKTGEYKVSLRSHAVDIGNVASYFGGGGHRLAAGCTVTGELDEIKNKVIDMVTKAVKKNG